MDRLFAVPELGPEDDYLARSDAPRRTSAVGKASELAAIARLLAMGHRVAVPVVDDDGVDFVVDYRTTVQVKSTGTFSVRPEQGQYGEYRFDFAGSQNTSRAGSKFRPIRAEVLVFHARPEDMWWIVPRYALLEAGVSQRVNFRPEPRIRCRAGDLSDQWLDAWHVFGEVD